MVFTVALASGVGGLAVVRTGGMVFTVAPASGVGGLVVVRTGDMVFMFTMAPTRHLPTDD